MQYLVVTKIFRFSKDLGKLRGSFLLTDQFKYFLSKLWVKDTVETCIGKRKIARFRDLSIYYYDRISTN